MKRAGMLTIGAALGLAGFSVSAQEEFPVLPVEMFACNYAGDSDMSDVNDAFDQFNGWADSSGIDDLTMFLLTPNFVSDEFEFDLLGMNIWPDGAAFGAGNAAIAADPDSVAGFEGVLDCAAHSLYALVGVKPPSADVESGALFEFTNCTMRGNRSNDEGVGAVAAVADYFERYNINDAHGALFNIAGLPSDTSYQFKWVTYYPDVQAWGSLFDGIVGDGAVQDLDAIINPVMRCDSSRIYNTTVMRLAEGE